MKKIFSLFGSLRGKMISIIFIFFLPLLALIHFYLIPLFQHKTLEHRKQHVKTAIEIAVGVLTAWEKRIESEKLSLESAQSHAKNEIQNLRYQSSEYFWIHNLDSKMVMHPIKPELNGKDLSDFKDSNGMLFFNQMNKIVMESGSGFLNYFWPKPGSEASVEKTSFVYLYKPWGWVIGTGVYIDDVRTEVADLKLKIWSIFYLIFIFAIAISIYITQQTNKKISLIASDLSQSSQIISSTVTELNHVGEELSSSSTKNASFLQETVASIVEITSMVKTNSENSIRAADLSSQTKTLAKEGELQMQNLLKSMHDIQNDSKKIVEITSIIDDISFQTNILSLNAAVEAARAGEQGKGFAVVADAVRTLAHKSSLSAKDITQLIKSSVAAIEASVVLAQKNHEILGQIVESVSNVSSLNQEISLANNEQANGIEQISKAMNELDQSTQSNASSALDVSKTTKEMTDLAQTTQQLSTSLDVIIHGEKKSAA